MQRVVRRRRTTVRIIWIEQTLTEAVEEVGPTPKTLAGPSKGESVEKPVQRRKQPRRPKPTLQRKDAANTVAATSPEHHERQTL